MFITTADISKVDSDKQHPLGSLFVESTTTADTGPAVWIYVYNDSGGALAQGDVLVRKSATSTYNVRKSATTSDPACVVGIAQHAIADGKYGWVLRRGVGEVSMDAAGSAKDKGIKVSNATAGTAEQVGGVTEAAFGWAIDDAITSALCTCFIDCRG